MDFMTLDLRSCWPLLARVSRRAAAVVAACGWLAVWPAQAATYTATGTPVAIPDYPGMGNPITEITIPIVVSGFVGPIRQMSVAVELEHTASGDLTLYLRSPNIYGGALFSLATRVSQGYPGAGAPGSLEDFNGTYTFVDENFVGAGDLWAAAAYPWGPPGSFIPPGNYRTTWPRDPTPSELLSAFSYLSDAQVNGTWLLRVSDEEYGNRGSIKSVQLTLIGANDPAPMDVRPVPTLGKWGLMLLGLLAAGMGARRLRRQG